MEEQITKKKLKIRKWVPITFLVIIFSIVSLSLFLIFKPTKEFKVSFKVNGGNNLKPLTINKNGKLEEPEEPTREGYEFMGWYYEGGLYDFTEPVTNDLVLEAKWTKKESQNNEEATEEEKVPVTGIALNTKTATLAPYETIQLKASFEPANATNKELEWESSNEKVAIADMTGKVKALKEGTTTITVKTVDGEFEASCTITVVKVKISSITIKGSSSLTIGSSTKLIVNVSPKNAKLDAIKWSSSDSTIASVDANGNVKGLKAGSVTITATSASGCVATYKITILAPSSSSKAPDTSQNDNPTPSVTPTPPAQEEPQESEPKEEESTNPEPDNKEPEEETENDESSKEPDSNKGDNESSPDPSDSTESNDDE